jgi:putative transposase
MLKGMKYRLYPTREQEALLARSFGCARYAYNWTIDVRSKAYAQGQKTPSRFDLNKLMTAEKKAKPWLAEVSDWVLKEAINHACSAYESFFAKRAGFPRFKSRRDTAQSATWRRPAVKGRNHVFVPKVGVMRFREHRPLKGDIKTVTVSRHSSGRYYICFQVDDGCACAPKPRRAKTAVGIDVGIGNFCTLSTGEKVANPHTRRSSQERIAKLQKKLARQKKGSNRYKETKRRLAREYEKVADRRRDFLQTLSTRLVNENQVIAVEDLNVKGMLANHRLAAQIADASWSEFVRMLEYKCEWYGSHLLRCGRFDPSSKMCSACGRIRKDMPLSVRSWECPECGSRHDRDVNAAVNILNFAVASTVNGRGEKVRLASVEGYPFAEPSASRRSVKPPALAVG